MSKVFVHLGVSVDGFIAGPNRGPKNPLGDGGLALHDWLFAQEVFREHLDLGGGGETGRDNDFARTCFDRIGADIMGKRMFEEGEANWPENAPFHCPVFVLTKEVRAPWEREGGTTFHFVNESLERVLARAREVANGKDVRISGGRDVVLQYLRAGLVEELILSFAPIFVGQGLRLFEGFDANTIRLELEETIASSKVTHVRYAVRPQNDADRAP
jgi:dihydrofolate reductase